MELKGKRRKTARISRTMPDAMMAASASSEPVRKRTATSSMTVNRTDPSGGRNIPYDVSCAAHAQTDGPLYRLLCCGFYPGSLSRMMR